MAILSRRSILAGAAAGAAATAFDWGPKAFALAPPAGKQAASFYRYKLGSMEITVLSDGFARVPVNDAFIPNVKTEEVKAALAEAFMDPNVFIGPYNPIVINTGSRLIVVDMGTGEANYNATNGVAGQLLANMAAAGIDPKAIDTVLISHYHGDHIKRIAARRQFAHLSQCGGAGAGAGAQILDGRRRNEPLADPAHRRQLQERAPGHQRRGAQAPAHL
jgi:hypothetical protein